MNALKLLANTATNRGIDTRLYLLIDDDPNETYKGFIEKRSDLEHTIIRYQIPVGKSVMDEASLGVIPMLMGQWPQGCVIVYDYEKHMKGKVIPEEFKEFINTMPDNYTVYILGENAGELQSYIQENYPGKEGRVVAISKGTMYEMRGGKRRRTRRGRKEGKRSKKTIRR
jgi:hypothetical protein